MTGLHHLGKRRLNARTISGRDAVAKRVKLRSHAMPPPCAIVDTVVAVKGAEIGDVPLTRLAINPDALDQDGVSIGWRAPIAPLDFPPPLTPPLPSDEHARSVYVRGRPPQVCTTLMSQPVVFFQAGKHHRLRAPVALPVRERWTTSRYPGKRTTGHDCAILPVPMPVPFAKYRLSESKLSVGDPGWIRTSEPSA